MSTKQIRRVVDSWRKIENQSVSESIICANTKPRDVVHSSISMSSSSLITRQEKKAKKIAECCLGI